MTSYNAFSYIPVMKTDFILKTSIDKKTCEELIEITKDKLDEEINDNLSNVRRTIWELHTDEDAGPTIGKIMDHMNYCIRTRLNFPHPNQSEPIIFEIKCSFTHLRHLIVDFIIKMRVLLNRTVTLSILIFGLVRYIYPQVVMKPVYLFYLMKRHRSIRIR